MKNSLVIGILIALIIFNNLSIISALSVTVHIPEKYTDIEPGERLYFEIEVKYPENPARKDLRLSYNILDAEGNLIAQSKVLKAVETQASFVDFIVIPESAKKGLHIINVNIEDYESLSEDVSTSFHITSKNSIDMEIYFSILLGAIILVGILVMISIFINKKKR